MLKRLLFVGHACAMAAGVALILPQPAEAKIKCKGRYQVVKGHGHLATPYCADGYLAKVARSYGVRISAATIRHNPNRKAEVCTLVGNDIRVSDICSQYIDIDGRNVR